MIIIMATKFDGNNKEKTKGYGTLTTTTTSLTELIIINKLITQN